MKQVVVLSGKGGTGKTSFTAAMVRLAGRCVAVDADVDAANLALLLPGEDGEWRTFMAGRRAVIARDSCTACLACLDNCPYHAVKLSRSMAPEVVELACEGCGVCSLVCPVGAIHFVGHKAGAWTVRRTAFGPLVHAELGVGEDNSGKLVAELRNEATRLASEERIELVIVDGPPGIGCPVHAAVGRADLVVAVTEPGVAAAHDLLRLLDLARHFHIPAAVVLNKADLDARASRELEALSADRGAPVLASIPFLPDVPKALAQGQGLLDVPLLRPVLEAAWDAIERFLRQPKAA